MKIFGLDPKLLTQDIKTLEQEAKKSFRQNARIHHPDKGGEKDAFQMLESSMNSIQSLIEKSREPIIASHPTTEEVQKEKKTKKKKSKNKTIREKIKARYKEKNGTFDHLTMIERYALALKDYSDKNIKPIVNAVGETAYNTSKVTVKQVQKRLSSLRSSLNNLSQRAKGSFSRRSKKQGKVEGKSL